MNRHNLRYGAIFRIDDACDDLERATAILNELGATHSMINRVQNLVAQLEDLRVDVMQCSLLVEEPAERD